ncbi:2767_t:CDS:2 [Funneliformis geosporum]|uniref:2236_t:CDS:1 n=1 Tax=Funneliformis geosporum TaxID=1117311 RepID=A0A9W4SPW7_9GLOM|nr:2236_t:CDS:2 [Funneliformis geosporum]CAI2178070.1 2767_t:CDS:2 [Funneliformis geosporum]
MNVLNKFRIIPKDTSVKRKSIYKKYKKETSLVSEQDDLKIIIDGSTDVVNRKTSERSGSEESNSNIIARTLSPDRVRDELEKFGLSKDEIQKWNKPIDIPFGATTELFVAREAILADLKFPQFDLYPELSIYAVGKGDISELITQDAKLLSPEEIEGGPVHDRFSNKKIFVYKMEKLHKIYKNVHQTITKPLEDKYRKKKFLYKGLAKWSFITSMFINGFNIGKNPENSEFGEGFYTTTNIDVAYKYAGKNGVLLIFDWTNDDEVNTKVLIGNEWINTVKGHLCSGLRNHPLPPQFRDDIFSGPFAKNDHSIIRACNDPIPNNQLDQFVGKTDASFAAFASHLYAIVYFY